MSDPSFDDLLESLDAIQAERSSVQYQRRDSSSDEDDGGRRHNQHHHAPAQSNQYSSPATHHAAPVQHTDYSYQASRDRAPVETYSAPIQHTNYAATPSRQGDMKQYQRQSVIQPSHTQHQHSSGTDTHCAKCNNTLYGSEYVTAGGKSYHQEHFVCAKCNKKLIGAYFDHHSQVYCPNCAGELMPCSKCHRGITGQYLVLDGRPHHTECVERKHCAQCHGPIEDTVLSALGKTWHTRCFTCLQCGKELGTQFIAKDGRGQCSNCADRGRAACEKCHNPLSGEFITFQEKSYHQDCFVCVQCRTRLGTSGFFSIQGQLKCQRCAK